MVFRSTTDNLKELYRYRALVIGLVRRELQVRYRGSVLGFLWTFLNPLMLMMIYALVFSVYLRNSMQNYTYFMFCGLLPWLWFSTSLSQGASSISDRRDLLTKVCFPPQILPATVVGAAAMNYVYSLPLILGFAWLKGMPLGPQLVLLPVVMLMQGLFSAGLAYGLAAANVRFRDLQHIVANLLSFLFFLTPIVYSPEQIPPEYRSLALTLNPYALLTSFYHDIFFFNRWPNPMGMLQFFAIAVVCFVVGSWFLASRREDLAEVA